MPVRKNPVNERVPGMIGIFDSRIGGLTVLRQLQCRLPDYDFVYFGDTARGPYGFLSPGTISSFVAEGLNRLVEMGARLLVVAGHCAAACLTDDFRERFPVPVLDILTSGVVPGLHPMKPKALGIIGSHALEKSGTYLYTLQHAFPETRLFFNASPLLQPIVEAGWLKKPETVMILKKYLHTLKLRQVDTLLPGSNHYSLLTRLIQRKMGKRVSIPDPAPVFGETVKQFLKEHPKTDAACSRGATCRVVVSDRTHALEKTAGLFYGRNVILASLD
jgi:glutamate racemase